ncbi:MAG: hypothetical protein WCI55_01230 [Armatimonadota bacterium]
MIITPIILSVCFGLSKPQIGAPSQGKKELSKEQEIEVNRQFVRFHSFARSQNYQEAESVLVLLESYLDPFNLRGEHVELALWRKDYSEAFKWLKLYFEGSGHGESVSVGGAEEKRIWYWFLLIQNGNVKHAEKVKVDLFQGKVRMPINPKYMDPTALSKNSFAQVYMYMAGYYNGTTNSYRSQKYIQLAKLVDPSVKIDPNFSKMATMNGYKDGVPGRQELSERFPMLDHTLFQKQLGKSVRIY